MMRWLYVLIICLSANTIAIAQRQEILASDVATLRVVVGNDWQSVPIATLNGDRINISFDQLSHEYHRYTYTVEHCDADWRVSQRLLPSDYISGFYDGNVIDDYELSQDTYQEYTHYRLTIPNEQLRLTRSGNYRLTVYDDDTDETVARACFMITEQSMAVGMGITTQTDLDINHRHQQLTMDLQYGDLKVSQPDTQIKTVVLQNRRWNTTRRNSQAQYRTPQGLRWEHARDLIFRAGVDYFKFETLTPSHPTMGIESVGWDEYQQRWQAFVVPDEYAKNYSYNPSAGGAYVIRNSDNTNIDTSTDYITTHFTLLAPRQQGSVYIVGDWTYDSFLPQYEMTWDDEEQCYRLSLSLKQGYYSYNYVVVDDSGEIKPVSTAMDFHETGNSYQVLVYFRSPQDRADRLVAYRNIAVK